MNKFFHYHTYKWSENNHQHHYQFLVIKDIVLLHLIYEVDNPCPFTGIRVLTSFFDPTCSPLWSIIVPYTQKPDDYYSPTIHS
jgi:hypothetical protein